MKDKNMTALISSFVRCYHAKNNKITIFNDVIADKTISKEEYDSISNSMANGINFFNSKFKGTKEEALKWIVDNQLSPSVLGRSAFCEKSLYNSIKLGCNQYLIYAAGYDTFAYRNNISNLKIFEIDKKEMIEDKITRLKNSNLDYKKVEFIKSNFTKDNFIDDILTTTYDKNQLSFNSLLGISYYLTKKEFIKLLQSISNITCIGSTIVFDYQTYDDSMETHINEELASAANENMKSKYTYTEIEKILSDCGFLIYEHLNNKEMTSNYFYNYNTLNPNNKINAPLGISYLLAVKKY